MIDTSELLSRVMRLWSPPAYYVLPEVRSMTGYGRSPRYADVLAMSVWPSRGIELIGAELKVSRTDWLREKKQPQKAEDFFRHCHRWYLISANECVQAVEIPETWGWIVAGKNGLKVAKPAPSLTPELPDWRMFASLFRKIGEKTQNMVSMSKVELLAQEMVLETTKRHEEMMAKAQQYKIEAERKHHELTEAIRELCNVAGFNLNGWRFSDIDRLEFERQAKLFRVFREGGLESLKNQLKPFECLLNNMVAQVKALTQSPGTAPPLL